MRWRNQLNGHTLSSSRHALKLPVLTRCRVTILSTSVAIGLAWLFCHPGTVRAESPTEAVRGTINQVIQILENKELENAAKVRERRRLLEQVIAARFDYAEMSKRTLATQWKSLTAVERDEFVELFKGFLSDRYAEKIEGYAGEQVQYLSERTEGEYAEVRTKLVSQKVNVPVDYRLIKRAESWHAYDIVVDGISLVKNYRSQFTKIIRDSSYRELVQRLHDRAIGDDKERAAGGQPKKGT